jgi:hypothetical protein
MGTNEVNDVPHFNRTPNWILRELNNAIESAIRPRQFRQKTRVSKGAGDPIYCKIET